MLSDTNPEYKPLPFNKTGWSEEYADIVLVYPFETLENYVSGGYHPISIGDTLSKGRYTILQKLGFGGYSTVWLAEDTDEERWVSIKIKQSRVSTTVDKDPEAIALQLLEKRHLDLPDPSTPRYFARLLDFFHHKGPNGTHACLVTELLGPSLDQVIKKYHNLDEPETFRPDTILRSARQLLEAVNFSHKSRLAHGDISPGNVAFTCRSRIDSNVEDAESLYKALGCEPRRAKYIGPQPRPANLPSEVSALPIWNEWFDSPEEDICLVDWGESFPLDQPVAELAQPSGLQSPETFFCEAFDHRHDLWRVGCVIYRLFFQQVPFGILANKDTHLQIISQVLGPLPPVWRQKWEQPREKSEIPQPSFKPLEDIFEPRRQELVSITEASEAYEREECTDDDYAALRCLLDVMKGLTRHVPAERMSAQEALAKIDWVDRWPELWFRDDDEGEGATGNEDDRCEDNAASSATQDNQ